MSIQEPLLVAGNKDSGPQNYGKGANEYPNVQVFNERGLDVAPSDKKVEDHNAAQKNAPEIDKKQLALQQLQARINSAPTYKTPAEFIDQITLKVDTSGHIYQHVDSYLYPTSSVDDEYVIVVLKIMDDNLKKFYGGSYIVQQWVKKRKLFQTVHKAKPNRFFLYKQRYVYSLQGMTEECQWIYIVNFFQEVFNKIRHPLYNRNSVDGTHEIQLFADNKMMLVASHDKIMWAPFKFEENKEKKGDGDDSNAGGQNDSKLENQLDQTQVVDLLEEKKRKLNEDKGSQNLKPRPLETSFRSVFSNLEGEQPEFLQFLDIGFEGFQNKEINLVCECEAKIVVYKILPVKLRKFTVFKISEKFRFDKQQIGLQFGDILHEVRLIQIGEQENIYLLTKGQGELILLTEKNIDSQQGFQLGRLTMKNVKQEGIEKRPKGSGENGDDPIEGGKDVIIRLKSFFVRRSNIYLEEVSGQIRCLQSNMVKLQKALKKTQRLPEQKEQIQLQEISVHLGFYSDYLIASTAIMLAHGKVLSIYDFKTSKWSHILPDQQGGATTTLSEDQNEIIDKDPRQSYFGVPDEEIQSLVLNNIFQNSIYDCLVLYKGKFLRRLKYFNEVQKTCFEKAIIFKGDRVKQIVKNYDMMLYRKCGDSQARTYFMVQSSATKKHDIWVSENGSRMTKLVRNIDQQWVVLKLQNAPSDLLVIYEQHLKRLSFYSIEHARQCLDPDELQKFMILRVEGWLPKEEYAQLINVNFFYFKSKLYYIVDGNLAIWNLKKKSQALVEMNFKSSLKEFFMTADDSVYYKDKNNVFRYANLKIQKVFDITKLPTSLYDCKGAFVQKLDYCQMTNRFACFTSPFQISITPNVNNNSIDLMSTLNFEQNFVFWKQTGNKLHAFKQPNIVVSWDLNTGKVLGSKEFNINLRGFKKHTDWNGSTLLKQVRDQTFDPNNLDEHPGDSLEQEEERKARMQFPTKQLFSLIDIDDDGNIKEVCRFIFDLKIGQSLYVSYPYVLMMDDECTKFFILQNLNGVQNSEQCKFKNLKFDNTFYEPQMKVGKPIYFSPNFHYRLFIDQESNKIILNNTLMNMELVRLDIVDHIMFQKKVTHPMIYFHDSDKIVYLTLQGIEKVFEIVQTKKKRRTLYSLKEIANCYYSRKELIRRLLIDSFNFRKDLSSQIKNFKMLQIRTTIVKRGLMLNEYLLDTVEDEKKITLCEYPDPNIGNFNYFIVDCFRRELNFSYLAWKVVEQIKNKKLSILNLKKSFVNQLTFTILPNQETILHYLNDNFEELEYFLKVINEVPQQKIGAKYLKKIEEDLTINDIPFLPNLQGQTPLHISIRMNNTRFTDRIVTVLADTEFDHHSRFIIDRLPYLVDQVPQALGYYFEHRQKTTDWIKNYTRGKMQPLNECEFMMASNNIWDENLDTTLPQQMFNDEVIEMPLNMAVLDLPNMQKFRSKNADKLLLVLSETENIELFSSASIRAIIELKWPLVKEAMVRKLLYPFLVMHLSFIYYAVYLFENLQDEDKNADGTPKEDLGWDIRNPDFWVQNQKQLIKIIILSLAGYFLLLNFRQFVIQGFTKYFTSPWNYIDLIPLTMISCSMIIEYVLDFPETERAINAISVFFLWIKCLYFLRMNRQSSKFISMIVAVIGDMRIFLAVFTVSLVTFSQSMFIISNNNPIPEDRFIGSFSESLLFTYRIALGDWDTGALGQTDAAIIITLFIMSTLFLCVVMLNLLIAVISDTYARVEGTSQNELYKNFADLIMENEYLVATSKFDEHDAKGSYLYIAMIDSNETFSDAWEVVISSLHRATVQRTTIVDKTAKELVKTMNSAIDAAKVKFEAQFNEDMIKSEAKFKKFQKKFEPNAGRTSDQLEGQSNALASGFGGLLGGLLGSGGSNADGRNSGRGVPGLFGSILASGVGGQANVVTSKQGLSNLLGQKLKTQQLVIPGKKVRKSAKKTNRRPVPISSEVLGNRAPFQ